MKQKIHHVGAFPDTLDPLMWQGTYKNVELFFIAAIGSVEEHWARQFLPAHKILALDFHKDSQFISNLEIEELIKLTDLAAVLKDFGVDSLIIPGVRTSAVHRWSMRNNIKILGPSYLAQRQLGNKIWFDRFCEKFCIPKPESTIFNFSRDKKLPFEGMTVIQDAESTAGQGTYFVSDNEELKKLVKSRVINRNKNYLARKFVEGTTYGISVFIGPNTIALSALRSQCFFEEDTEGRKVFAGIQWISFNDLSRNVVARIDDTFLRLGRILHTQRYFGFANFDFLVDEQENVHLIECNPRLSYASAQLFRFPELCSDIDLGTLFIQGYFSRARYVDTPAVFGLPESTYRGATLEIVPSLEPLEKKVKIIREHPVGLYVHGGRSIRFRQHDIRNFKRLRKELVFYSSAKRGERYSGLDPIGRIVTNFPLFTPLGSINSDAGRLIERFSPAA